MGQFDESLPYFHNALRTMSSPVPTTRAKGCYGLLFNMAKQYAHSKHPPRCSVTDNTFLDVARCLGHTTHIYQKQGKKMMALMTILARLNAAEKARENYSHEVSYSHG